MPRLSRAQQQFNAGELGPSLFGRADLDQYRSSARTMVNFVPLREGPVTRRPGLRYVGQAKDQANPCHLVPFEFNVAQTYVLEFSAGFIRFYADQGQVLFDRDPANGTFTSDISGWTERNAGTGDCTHDAGQGRMNLIGGGGGNIARANHELVNIGASVAYTLTVDVFVGNVTVRVGTTAGAANILADTALTPGLGKTVTFTTPAANGSAFIEFENGAAAGHQIDNVTLDSPLYQIDNPYAAADIHDLQYAQQEDVLYLAHPSYAPRKLTRAGHASWKLETYAPAGNPFGSATNYPAAVTLFQERLVWGGTLADPNKLWLSKVADPETLTIGTNDNDAFTATLAGPTNDVIRWLKGVEVLVIGTTGGEWATRRGLTLTPTARAVTRLASNGCAPIQAVDVDGRVLYVRRLGEPQNRGEILGAIAFSFEDDGYVVRDLTVLSPHIGAGGITDIAWQQSGGAAGEAHRVLWCVRADGVLLSLVYDPQQQVIGWARHMTDGVIESVCTIPGLERDEVWLEIKRTVNGQTKRYIELLDPDLNADSALVGTAGSPTLTWAGLSHLEGKTVAIVANGSPVNPKVVAGGQIVLDVAAAAVEIGLAYVSTLEPNDLAEGAPEGSALARPKSNWQIALLLSGTVGLKIDGKEVTFREVGQAMDSAIPAFSGYKKLIGAGWSESGRFTLVQEIPKDCTILAFVAQTEVGAA